MTADFANQIVEMAADGILAIDGSCRVIVWNRTMARVFSTPSQQVLGEDLFERFPVLESVKQSLLDVMRGKAVSTTPFPVPSSTGCEVYEASYRPLVVDGETVGAVAVIREISAYLQSQRELTESEDRFRNMADGAPVLLWMSATDGLCTFFNARWYEFTGQTEAHETGIGWAQGVHAEDLQECMHTYLDAFVARREFRMEYRLRRSDGQFRWVLDVGRPRYTTDGHFAGYVGSCVDVTEMKEASAALEALKHELERRVVERTSQLASANNELLRREIQLSDAEAIAHIGSWRWEIAEGTVTWSEELYRIFGVDRDGFLSSYEAYMERIHPADRERVHALIQEAYGSLQPFGFDHRIIRPDGEVRTLKCAGQVVADRAGRPVRMLGTAQDITDHRRSEETRLRLAQEQLAREEAQRAVEHRDVFLSVAAHELRTPLNALMLGLETFERAVRNNESGSLDWIALDGIGLEMLSRQTHRLAKLVENLLDHSQIAAGRLKIVAVELDFATTVRDVVDRLGDEAMRAGCTVALHAGGEIVGSWDKLRIEQVVTNLLSNALKYGQKKPVEVSVEGDEHVARLRVRDHGIGIAAEDLPRLFRPYERVASVRHFGGLGLGLHVAKQIVEAHGGAIVVDSTLGVGSTFLVELPRRPIVARRGPAASLEPELR